MNRIFHPRGYLKVPDGTDVSAFLNATDATQEDVPWGVLGEMSVAAGRIGPKLHSWVHIHPAVTQVTYVVSGNLSVRMKDAGESLPYDLQLGEGQAVVVESGTLFQLRNDSHEPAEVLYIVSPSYVFELKGQKVVYDDAIVVAKTWEELEAAGYAVPSWKVSHYEAKAGRAEAERRLAARKGRGPEPLAQENLWTLKDECDYLAPDGSEIRLLASGERGGLVHCVLPAGKVSAAVRHRTVEELWYVLEGTGRIWRGRHGEAPCTDSVRPGDSIRISVGAAFQFQADPGDDLKLLIATMPPWPGPREALPATGGLNEESDQ